MRGGSHRSRWPCSQEPPEKASREKHMSWEKRNGGASLGFLRAIFSALKFALMLMLPPFPLSAQQRLTREVLTFEARALGSDYLLLSPCIPTHPLTL